MPIVRSYMCPLCAHTLELTLTMDQWDSPPPVCPVCAQRQAQSLGMQQEFKPIAIGGSDRSKATKIAETIAEQDYGVADMQVDGKQGGRPKVRYKDANPGGWGNAAGVKIDNSMLETAAALGRQTRLANGGVTGLDMIRQMPDLIAASKAKSIKIW